MRRETSIHSSEGRLLRKVRPEFAGKPGAIVGGSEKPQEDFCLKSRRYVRATYSDFVSNVNTSGRE